MEERKTKGGDLQFCKVIEEIPLHYDGTTKKPRSCIWFALLVAMILVVVLASAVTYLVIANRDCSANSELIPHNGDGTPGHTPGYLQDDMKEYKENQDKYVLKDDEIWPTLSLTADILTFVSTCNCTQVYELLERIEENEVIDDLVTRLRKEDKLHEYLLRRARELSCDEADTVRHTDLVEHANLSSCPEQWVGDGWCDLVCNTAQYRYDDGDCCADTCTAMPRIYQCGIIGYDCKLDVAEDTPPSWFTNGNTQMCYEWYPDGDGGQCGGGAARRLCAAVDSYTDYYRDDTDSRDGGCRMRWGVTSSGADAWFRKVQICYSWYADGNDGGQCGGDAAAESCVYVNSYTDYYRDDTDSRDGGCRMSWKLKVPEGLRAKWMYDVKLCFQWYPDGDGGQCGVSGTSQILCASTNQWTPYYRDDTDGRDGGCRMRWGLCLNGCT